MLDELRVFMEFVVFLASLVLGFIAFLPVFLLRLAYRTHCFLTGGLENQCFIK